MLKEDLTWCIGRIKKLEERIEKLEKLIDTGEGWEVFDSGKTLKDIGWKGPREDEPLLLYKVKED